MDILKQHLKTSVRELKLGCKWFFQLDSAPKHTSKVMVKWLKDNKVKVLEWPSRSPDLKSYRKCVGRTEKVCVSKEADKLDSVKFSSVWRNGPKFTLLIAGSLWKASQNV